LLCQQSNSLRSRSYDHHSTVSPVAKIEALCDRLTRARNLVADNKVHQVYGLVNHFIVEGKEARYLVNGSCICPDAQNRPEAKGLCKHKLAAVIYSEQQAQAETSKATRKSKAESPLKDEELERKVSDLYN
jgi:hypothetical protein